MRSLTGFQTRGKRKAIGYTFIEVFEKFARNNETKFTHLGQGTLYPDVIESAGHGDGSKVIKSHHNVEVFPKTSPFIGRAI